MANETGKSCEGTAKRRVEGEENSRTKQQRLSEVAGGESAAATLCGAEASISGGPSRPSLNGSVNHPTTAPSPSPQSVSAEEAEAERRSGELDVASCVRQILQGQRRQEERLMMIEERIRELQAAVVSSQEGVSSPVPGLCELLHDVEGIRELVAFARSSHHLAQVRQELHSHLQQQDDGLALPTAAGGASGGAEGQAGTAQGDQSSPGGFAGEAPGMPAAEEQSRVIKDENEEVAVLDNSNNNNNSITGTAQARNRGQAPVPVSDSEPDHDNDGTEDIEHTEDSGDDDSENIGIGVRRRPLVEHFSGSESQGEGTEDEDADDESSSSSHGAAVGQRRPLPHESSTSSSSSSSSSDSGDSDGSGGFLSFGFLAQRPPSDPSSPSSESSDESEDGGGHRSGGENSSSSDTSSESGTSSADIGSTSTESFTDTDRDSEEEYPSGDESFEVVHEDDGEDLGIELSGGPEHDGAAVATPASALCGDLVRGPMMKLDREVLTQVFQLVCDKGRGLFPALVCRQWRDFVQDGLSSITFPSGSKQTNMQVLNTLSFLRGLKGLRFAPISLQFISAATLRGIATRCPRLESLEVEAGAGALYCTVTPMSLASALSALVRNCLHLKVLRLNSMPELRQVLPPATDKEPLELLSNLEGLAHQLTGLKTLAIKCPGTGVVPPCVTALTGLRKLHWEARWVRDPETHSLPVLRSLSWLESLSLAFSAQFLPSLSGLTDLSCLKSLTLTCGSRSWDSLEVLGKLTMLRRLKVQGHARNFEFAGRGLGSLVGLKTLILEALSSSQLHEGLGNLSSLTYLCISNCFWLETLPVSFSRLVALQRLHIESCAMFVGPPPLALELMPSLTSLTVSHCLSAYVKLPRLSTSIEKLDVCKVKHCQLPDNLSELTNLTLLSAIADRSHSRSSSGVNRRGLRGVALLSSLRSLSLSNHVTSTLPEGFSALSSLRDLLVRDSKGRLIEGVGSCELDGLTSLVLEGRRSMVLPLGISRLTSLRRLRIHSIDIRSLGIQWGMLRCLQFLRLDYCSQIKALPSGMAELTSLEELQVFKCGRLTELPPWLRSSASLKRVSVGRCKKLVFRLGPPVTVQ